MLMLDNKNQEKLPVSITGLACDLLDSNAIVLYFCFCFRIVTLDCRLLLPSWNNEQ